MTDKELKPCAHCGSNDVHCEICANNLYDIYCEKCGSGFSGLEYEEYAIEAWNTRHAELRGLDRKKLSNFLESCVHLGSCIYDKDCHKHKDFIDAFFREFSPRPLHPLSEDAFDKIEKIILISDGDDRFHKAHNATKEIIAKFGTEAKKEIEWPEKKELCPHQNINPKQLCLACSSHNDAIDACKEAYFRRLNEPT